MKFFSTLLLIFSSCINTSALPIEKTHFSEVAKLKPGGEGGWDYLVADSASKRLYLSHSERVQVLDSDSGKTIFEVTDTPGVHGIALAPELGLGFTSNGKTSTVSAFDLKTGKVIATIKVGQNPDAIVYDSFTKLLYTFNGKSHDMSVVDPKEKKLLKTLPLSSKPEFAVTDEAGHLYVNLEDENALVKINAKDLKIEAKYSLKPCEEPTGLAIDEKTNRLFVGCGNRMMAVVNAENGKVLKTYPVGSQVDATAFDSARNLIFVSAGEGLMTVIHEKSANDFEMIENVKTQKGARTMTVDSKSGKVFLVSADFGSTPKTSAENPKPRPTILPNTFVVLVLATASK